MEIDKKIIVTLKERLAMELIKEGCIWRVLRLSSLSDMIVLNFYFYSKGSESKYLFEILSLCVKAKILLEGHVSNSPLSSNISSQLQTLKEEEGIIMQAFNDILDIMSNYERNENLRGNAYKLYDDIQYLKTISQLKIDDIPEEHIDRVFWGCFQLLLDS